MTNESIKTDELLIESRRVLELVRLGKKSRRETAERGKQTIAESRIFLQEQKEGSLPPEEG